MAAVRDPCAVPSRRRETPAGLSEPDLRRIQIATVSRADIERPSGRRFGALVHAVLAAVNLDASTDEIAAVAQANARLIDATAG